MKRLKKRIVSAVLAAATALCAVPLTEAVSELFTAPVTARAVTPMNGKWDNCNWTLDSNGTLTVTGSGAFKPRWYESYYDTYTASFPKQTDITSVSIGPGITSIGSVDLYNVTTSFSHYTWYGFQNCTNLRSVTIPSTLNSLCSYCFNGCTKLTSISFSGCSNLTSIPNDCFKNSTQLSSVTLPPALSIIEGSGFSGCTALTAITFPESLETIGEEAFAHSGLKSLTTKKYLTSIGISAFSGCASLASLTLAEGLKTIAKTAFNDCDALTSVTIPASVESIGSSAFQNCLNLQNVTLKEGLITIGNNAFNDCDNLLNVTVPASVTSVGSTAFGDCLRLESVKFLGAKTGIYDSKSTIYNRDSTNCYYDGKIIGLKDSTAAAYANKYSRTFEEFSLEPPIPTSGTCGTNLTWNYDEATGELTVSGAGAMMNYTEASAQPWYRLAQKKLIRSIVVNEGVTTIGNYAFHSVHAKFIDLPTTLRSIGTYGLAYNDFRSLYMPDSVNSVNNYAFYYCQQLTSVHISTALTGLPFCTFYRCTALRTVTVPESVTQIGNHAFGANTALTDIYVLNRACTFYDAASAVYDSTANVTPYSFSGKIHGYQNSTAQAYAKKYRYSFEPIDKEYCGEFLKWSYSDGTLTIRGSGDMFTFDSQSAVPWYQYRNSIQHVVLPAGLTSVTRYAFYGLSVLTEIEIPASVLTVADSALGNCRRLDKVTFRGKDTTIYNSKSTINNSESYSSGGNSYYFNGNICGYYDSAAYRYAENTGYCFRPIDTTICGENLTCSYDASTKTLTISGTGDMYDFRQYAETPWYAYYEEIEKIIVGEGVTSVGNHAFEGTRNAAQVTLPTTLKRIGDSAFQGCYVLSLMLPEGLESIGRYAFMYTENLNELRIPGTVTSFGYGALNASLENDSDDAALYFGEGITEIPAGLASCSRAVDIYLPESCTKIGENAFAYCSNFYSITILNRNCEIYDSEDTINRRNEYTVICGRPGSTAQAYAEKYGFRFEPIFDYSCGEDLTWSYNEDTQTLTISGSGAMTDYTDDPAPWSWYETELKNVVFQTEGLTNIGARAFKECTALKNITIPDSVTQIGREAFQKCTSLTDIIIPERVINIGTQSFDDCLSLTNVTLPDSLIDIGPGAFRYAPIAAITIPASVKSFSLMAFAYCDQLKTVSFLGNPPSMHSSAFRDVTATVYYPGDNAAWTEEVRQNYGGTLTWIPVYQKQDLSAAGAAFTLSKTVFAYTGKAVKVGSYVSLKIGSRKLKYGQDFTLEYSSNVNIGYHTAKVTAVGMGDYTGSLTAEYSIVPVQQAAPALSWADGKFHVAWTADSQADGYQVQYCQSADFTGDTLHSGSYAKSKTSCDLSKYQNPGETWYVRVKAFVSSDHTTAGSKAGVWGETAHIQLTSNTVDSVTLSQETFAYTGSPVKVGSYITVKSGDKKLKYNTDFTMEYSDNTAIGINTAKVTVKGIGNYTGTVVKTYTIAPAKQAAPTLTAVSGGFKVTWNNDPAAAGYQVVYSKDPTLSTSDPSYHAQTYAAGKTSATLTKYSQTGEKWYVKVRAFITADGTTSGTKYGVYSESASITAG